MLFIACNSSVKDEAKKNPPEQNPVVAPNLTGNQALDSIRNKEAHFEFDKDGKQFIVNPDGKSALYSETHPEFDKDGNQFAVAPGGTTFKLGKEEN